MKNETIKVSIYLLFIFIVYKKQHKVIWAKKKSKYGCEWSELIQILKMFKFTFEIENGTQWLF